MATCYQGIQIPTLQNDPCNGETKNSECIIHPDALTLLELPENTPIRDIINTYATALNTLLNRTQALETLTEDLEARILILES